MKPKHRKPFKGHKKPHPPRRDEAKHDRSRQDRPREPAAPARENLPRPTLFGIHAVREAWRNPERYVKALYVTEGLLKDLGEDFQKGTLKRPAPTILPKHDIDRLCPPGAVHQGIAMLADNLPEVFLQDLIIKAAGQDNSLILMLDQVTDPHNVGAILRSAAAFQIDGVIMQRKHAPELTGVLAKTACGAVEHMPVAYETNLSRALEGLKENGYFVYGLDEHGARGIGEMKKGGKVVLVLGAEGDGLRRLIKEHCDALVRLPTGGAIASLNVSNAAAVALYALKG